MFTGTYLLGRARRFWAKIMPLNPRLNRLNENVFRKIEKITADRDAKLRWRKNTREIYREAAEAEAEVEAYVEAYATANFAVAASHQ
jgi:hypothetical protein